MEQSTLAAKPRIEYIDLAKGFCIILVVFYHYCGEDIGSSNPINTFFRTFRMPLYFILSGLFFKEYEGVLGFTRRKVNKLLVPLAFFSIISAIIFFVIHNCWKFSDYIETIIFGLWKENIIGNMPIWFLWCLFLNNILFYFVILFSKNKKHSFLYIGIICTICGILGYFLGRKSIDIPFFIDTALTTTPFFAFGYCLRKYTQVLYPNKYDKYLLLQVLAYFFLVVIFMQRSDLYTNNMRECSIFTLYLCGAAGSLGILSLAKIFHHLPIISYLGRYSIIILCTHMIPGSYLYLFKPMMAIVGIESTLVFHLILFFIILTLEYFLFIPIIKKYLPHVSAQKDLF